MVLRVMRHSSPPCIPAATPPLCSCLSTFLLTPCNLANDLSNPPSPISSFLSNFSHPSLSESLPRHFSYRIPIKVILFVFILTKKMATVSLLAVPTTVRYFHFYSLWGMGREVLGAGSKIYCRRLYLYHSSHLTS